MSVLNQGAAKPGTESRMSPLNAWAFSFACAIGWAAFVMPGTFFLPKGGFWGSILAFAVALAARKGLGAAGFPIFYLSCLSTAITRLWQVSGRSSITDFEEVIALDRKYIENWSVWLDIMILFRTVKVVLKHEGAS